MRKIIGIKQAEDYLIGMGGCRITRGCIVRRKIYDGGEIDMRITNLDLNYNEVEGEVIKSSNRRFPVGNKRGWQELNKLERIR